MILRLFITIITIITLAIKSASAATSTPSATTVIDKLKKIEILKEKIATKVEELREKEKGGLVGTVKSIKDTTITLTTKKGERIASYSEDTIFYKLTHGEKSEALDYNTAKKINVGESIAALGYFDQASSILSGKYIYLVSQALHLIGKIADIDKSNFTITVRQPQGNTIVDIETYSKIFSYNKKTLTKIGFSKLKIGDAVHIFATPNPKEEGRASSTKIITLNFLPSPTATPAASLSKDSSPSATPVIKQ